MKKLKLVCWLSFLSLLTNAQLETRLLKLLFVKNHGVTDTVDNMPINIATNGNVVISGNQKINATQYDATTIEQTTSGVTTWINQYNPTGQKSFVTASCLDATGNVYNVGAIRTSTTNGIDFLIMKIDPSGAVLWATTYNGPNSTNDVASGVCLDNNGNLYVTGASDGSLFSLVDYCTLRLNAATGATVWVSRYDNSSMDIPTGITFDLAMNEVVVSGSSGNSLNDWDFCTVSYNLSSGLQTDIIRTPNPAGTAQDKILGIASDGQGNIYNVGTTFNGTNYDIKLEKLDTALNVVYSKIIDVNGYDDAGINVSVDGNDNVILAGSAFLSNGLKEMVVRKYDKFGNFKWEFKRQPKQGQDAEALRIKVKSSNEYFVVGNCGSGAGQDIAILCLDSLGGLRIEKQFDGNGFRDRFMDMAIDGNFIYISARTMTSNVASVENNIAIKYEYQVFVHNITTVGSGISAYSYVDKEMIISFDKNTVKMNAINNKEFMFGALSDFVQDSTCLKVENALDPENVLRIDAKKLPVRKIYFDMTEADSLSQTRLGNYVRVPEFYCDFVISLPNTINTTNAISPLNTVKPDIHYAQYNNVFSLATNPPPTNDPSFISAQGNLHAISGYSLGHLNADTAWAITTGNSFIGIGILDSGIHPHTDLGSSFPGYDFTTPAALFGGDPYGHGTAVAGVCGAIRNNNIGIAGLAGGDASSNMAGVTLYDMKTSYFGQVLENWVAPAILKGSQGTNIGGYGLNILNMSLFYGGAYLIRNWGHGVASETIRNLNFASRNGVAMPAAKANFNNLGTNIFPADWSDEILMSVGSNGFNGEYCRSSGVNANCTGASTQWGQIDFVAPGTGQLVTTTKNDGTYQQYQGTSIATPQVAAAVGLMMSYRNKPYPHWDNLAPEDCEQILQRTTTDCKDSLNYAGEKTGYDSLTGWGRLNVTRAIREINKNYYRFRHITELVGNTSVITSTALVFSDTLTWTNYSSIPTNTYNTQVIVKTSTINFNLLPGEVIVGYWPLNKETYGTKLDTTFMDGDRPYNCKIISVTNSQAVLQTSYYKNTNLNVYAPYRPDSIRSAFTLYTFDPTGTVGIKENPNLVNQLNFRVYPNPNSGEFLVAFGSDMNEQLNYKVMDILGKEVISGSYYSHIGKNEMKVSLPEMPNGVYILKLYNGAGKIICNQKVIRQ